MNTKFNSLSAAVAVALMATAGPVAADGAGRVNSPTILEGTWVVAITPYDCASGQHFPVTIKARHTFTAGGTMVESTSGISFLPGQRGPGLGYWERIGPRDYRAVFEAYVLFDGAGYARGTQRFDQGISEPAAPFDHNDRSVLFDVSQYLIDRDAAAVADDRDRRPALSYFSDHLEHHLSFTPPGTFID